MLIKLTKLKDQFERKYVYSSMKDNFKKPINVSRNLYLEAYKLISYKTFRVYVTMRLMQLFDANTF